MKHLFARAGLVASALLGAAIAPAAAQDAPPGSVRTIVPASFPRWDAGGSFGFLSITTSDTDSPWDGWEQKAEYRFDIGRYWTTHLKTEVALSTSNAWQDYDSVRLSVPGVPSAYAYDTIDRQLHTVAPGLTWQFRENTFMHPFVTGGVKIGFLQEHRHREAATYRSGSVNYPISALDERRTVVQARPFLGGGFKSYLSRAVFVRTEARVGFASDGPRQLSMLIGIGGDF